jgi:ribonucleotide reductase beta subunit family protein with ferritin-like domain
MDKTKHDPILDEEEECDRFVVGEISNSEAYLLYKQQLSLFWVSDAIDMGTDHVAFGKMRSEEQQFLLKILAFFAGSDGIVLENAVTRFYAEVKQAEVRLFYGLQIAIENVHSETYTELIRVLERNNDKRKDLFKAISLSKGVKAKANWAEKYMRSDASFGERLVAFACVEGIMFSASFAAIFYLKKRGFELPGLFQSNEYISRDEALHTRFAVVLYKQLQKHNKISDAKIKSIVNSAVAVEEVFVREALPRDILGMNATVMIQYVRFVADCLMQMFGLDKIFDVPNPFDWMDMLSVENKSNFFERRVVEYNLAEVKMDKQQEENNNKIGFSEDF